MSQPENQLVGQCRSFRQYLAKVHRVAKSNAAVLILGETGTGKELTAEEIHKQSNRSEGPFVSENIARIAPSLAGSDLFGHDPDAFSEVTSHRKGLFLRAHGGTLFLDEIGNMHKSVQDSLLRVLQEKIVRREGSDDEQRVDVRVIAATNADLKKLVKTGRFREDLYYRLNALTVKVPTLRERADDIPLLVAHFLGVKRSEEKVVQVALEALCRYEWPGNIRELIGVLEAAQVEAEDNAILDVEHFPPEIQEIAKRLARDQEDDPDPEADDPANHEALKRDAEKLVEKLDELAASADFAQDAAAISKRARSLIFESGLFAVSEHSRIRTMLGCVIKRLGEPCICDAFATLDQRMRRFFDERMDKERDDFSTELERHRDWHRRRIYLSGEGCNSIGRELFDDMSVPAHERPLVDLVTRKQHAVVEKTDGKWIIRDCGSTNKTYVRNHEDASAKRVESGELHDRDVIQLGPNGIELRFTLEGHVAVLTYEATQEQRTNTP